jgi:hypothetical protein
MTSALVGIAMNLLFGEKAEKTAAWWIQFGELIELLITDEGVRLAAVSAANLIEYIDSRPTGDTLAAALKEALGAGNQAEKFAWVQDPGTAREEIMTLLESVRADQAAPAKRRRVVTAS